MVVVDDRAVNTGLDNTYLVDKTAADKEVADSIFDHLRAHNHWHQHHLVDLITQY